MAASYRKGGRAMKNFTRKAWVSLLMAIPFLFALMLPASSAQAFSGIVSIDVNPSIELTVENGVVTAASAYNDDGKQLLSGGGIAGLTAEEAVRVMTRLLIEGGFLSSDEHTPYLLITESGGDAAGIQALRQTAEQVALELNAMFEIRSGQVPDEVAAAAEAAGLTPGKYLLMLYIAGQEGKTLEEAVALYGAASIGELADQFGDFSMLLTDTSQLTEEQMVALYAAFKQMKSAITAAEKTYQDAIKALKERYRVATQDATKFIQDEAELAAVIDRLKTEILADYEGIQKTLDGDTAAAREEFLLAADAALIPKEIADSYVGWHLNKELNASSELINFLDSFKNLAGNGKNGENSGQQNMNGNVEQNQETNKNQGEPNNKEQEQQQEQNGEGDQDQGSQNQGGKQQGNQQGQSQGSSKSAKGKGGN
jgi:hypothetical protein